MRTTVSGAFAAAALASAMFIAGALPASAQVARPLSALAVGDSDDGIVTLVRRGGGGGGGMRGGGGGGMRMGGGGYHGGGRVAMAHRGGVHRAGMGDHRVAARHHRHHNGHHKHHRHHHHGHGHGNWWWGAGGFALGYGLGGYGYGYGYPYGAGYYDEPGYYVADAPAAYCIKRVRVYDRATKSYVVAKKRRVCAV